MNRFSLNYNSLLGISITVIVLAFVISGCAIKPAILEFGGQVESSNKAEPHPGKQTTIAGNVNACDIWNPTGDIQYNDRGAIGGRVKFHATPKKGFECDPLSDPTGQDPLAEFICGICVIVFGIGGGDLDEEWIFATTFDYRDTHPPRGEDGFGVACFVDGDPDLLLGLIIFSGEYEGYSNSSPWGPGGVEITECPE